MAEMTDDQIADLTRRVMGETASKIWQLVDEEFRIMAAALEKAADLPNAGELAPGLRAAADSLRKSANHSEREARDAVRLLGDLS